MSNFRERARAIKEAGVEERSNFTPTGAPLRIYQWWHARTQYAPATDNFCHFWRVVVFWAPFMFLRHKAEDFFSSKTGIVLAVLVTLGVFAWTFTQGNTGWLITLIIASAALSLWLLVGILLGTAGEWQTLEGYEPDKYEKWAWTLTFPISAPLGAITRIRYRNTREFDRVAVKVLIGTLLTLLGAAVIFFLTVLFLKVGLWTFAIVFGGLALFTAAVFAFSALGDFIAGKRLVAQKKQWAAEDAREAGDVEAPAPKVPSAFSLWLENALRSVGDFIVLAAQVVRVKKWKICPLVEVPEKNEV